MSQHNIDDFIIPDEEQTPSYGASSNDRQNSTPPASNPATNVSTSGPSFFSFGKVDLSSAFTPFASQSGANNTVREHQYTGGDTLEEPVLETLKRDGLNIWNRLKVVIWPHQLAQKAREQQSRLLSFARTNGIDLPQLVMENRRISVSNDPEDATGPDEDTASLTALDWDLWGPLMFSLLYSVALGMSASSNQTNSVFSGSFSFMWIFFILIGLNIQLLGGNISFMSAISAVGYSMFPIALGELLCSLVIHWAWLRLIVMTILCIWSIYSGVMSLKCSGVLPGRVVLAVYPVALMYGVLSWLAIIT